jgi:prenyl protein peptidase
VFIFAMANVWSAPKAPAISPNTAALLSVRPAPYGSKPPPCRYDFCLSGCMNCRKLDTRLTIELQVLFTFIYVVPFYLSSATRPSAQLTRDAPSCIRARIRAVTFSSALSLALTIVVLHHYGGVPPQEILQLIGFWPISLFDTARTMLLVAILFAGPLFEYGIVENGLKDWVRGRGMYQVLSSWIGYRNYVVVRLRHSSINTNPNLQKLRALSAKS